MPSAYVLAKDNLEQARAIVGNEVWFDATLDHLLSCAILRLVALDAEMNGGRPPIIETLTMADRSAHTIQFFRKPD